MRSLSSESPGFPEDIRHRGCGLHVVIYIFPINVHVVNCHGQLFLTVQKYRSISMDIYMGDFGGNNH